MRNSTARSLVLFIIYLYATVAGAQTITSGPDSGIPFGTGVVSALQNNLNAIGGLVGFNGSLGIPAQVTLTNGNGLPIATGLSGVGSGVLTALQTNVGSSGSFVVNGGALGTPSSGVGTNLTGIPLSTAVIGLLTSANGGTGLSTITASNCIQGNSAGTAIIFGSCGSGTASLSINSTTTIGGAAGQVMYDNGSLLQESAGLVFTGTGLRVAGGTITTSLPQLSSTVTWNNVSTVFDAPWLLNVVNTASATGSVFEDIQLGGVSQFNVGIGGAITQSSAFTGTLNSLTAGTGSSGFKLITSNITLALGNLTIARTDNTSLAAMAFGGFWVPFQLRLGGSLLLPSASLSSPASTRIQSSGDIEATGAAATVSAGQIAYGSTTAAATSCGSLASSLGCIVVNIAGTTQYIPYY